MGTSKSWSGPTGNNPLLPPWAEDVLPEIDAAPDDGDAEPDGGIETDGAQTDGGEKPDSDGGSPSPDAVPPKPQPPATWNSVKSTMTRLARGTSKGGYAPVFRKYVSAHRGGRAAAGKALTGRAVARGFGGFLADVVRVGTAEATRRLGLAQFVGRDAEFVLAAFVDLLAPNAALLEDNAARKALIETTLELFERYDIDRNGLEALDGMGAEGMKEVVCLYVTNYVFERFLQEVVSRIENNAQNEREANALCEQGKEFVRGEVECGLETVDVLRFDWQGAEGERFVLQIFERAYSLLGAKR